MPIALMASLLYAATLGAAPTPSPRAPKPRSPAEGIYYEDDPRALRIGFQWSRTGTEFQFQLSRDSGFREVVVDRRLSSDGLDLERLDVGEYFWRVAAFAANGVRGAFSEPSCFFLTTTERQHDDLTLTCAALRSLQERRKASRARTGQAVAR